MPDSSSLRNRRIQLGLICSICIRVQPESSIPTGKLFPSIVSYIKCDLNTDLSELKNILVKTDLFLLLDVLEHLYNPEKFLIDIQKLMKPRSMMVISVPNASSVRKLHAWLVNDFPREDIGYFDRTHRSWFTTKSIKKLLPENCTLIK